MAQAIHLWEEAFGVARARELEILFCGPDRGTSYFTFASLAAYAGWGTQVLQFIISAHPPSINPTHRLAVAPLVALARGLSPPSDPRDIVTHNKKDLGYWVAAPVRNPFASGPKGTARDDEPRADDVSDSEFDQRDYSRRSAPRIPREVQPLSMRKRSRFVAKEDSESDEDMADNRSRLVREAADAASRASIESSASSTSSTGPVLPRFDSIANPFSSTEAVAAAPLPYTTPSFGIASSHPFRLPASATLGPNIPETPASAAALQPIANPFGSSSSPAPMTANPFLANPPPVARTGPLGMSFAWSVASLPNPFDQLQRPPGPAAGPDKSQSERLSPFSARDPPVLDPPHRVPTPPLSGQQLLVSESSDSAVSAMEVTSPFNPVPATESIRAAPFSEDLTDLFFASDMNVQLQIRLAAAQMAKRTRREPAPAPAPAPAGPTRLYGSSRFFMEAFEILLAAGASLVARQPTSRVTLWELVVQNARTFPSPPLVVTP